MRKTKKSDYTRITINIPIELLRKIDERGGERPSTISRDLSALYELEDYALQELIGKFTKEELYLIVDAINGWLYTPRPNPSVSLIAEVEDAILHEFLDNKWKVSKENLLSKLKTLTSFQAHVLIIYLQKALQEKFLDKLINLLV